MKLVLDTNVWLDWLVFADARAVALAHAFAAGRLDLLATDAMAQEFDQVIARPAFKLPPDRLEQLPLRFRALVKLCGPAPDCRLPCTDRDDQQFIDLAVAHRVDWLLSRDRALLRLRRLGWQRFGLRIGTPEQWSAYNVDKLAGLCSEPGDRSIGPPLRP